MKWRYGFIAAADKELQKLDNNTQKQVLAAIEKVSNNPLPRSDGGYGKTLGNKDGKNLTGYFKIVLKDLGIRVVYKLDRDQTLMIVAVMSERDDEYCYKLAHERHKKGKVKLEDKEGINSRKKK